MTLPPAMRHLDDLELSELTDDRPTTPQVAAHATQCAECRLRLAQLQELRTAAAHERTRTYSTPDPWPLIAALTVHQPTVRRVVLKRLRVPLIAWTVIAFSLGAAAAEAIRDLSRAAAEKPWEWVRAYEKVVPRR